MNAVHSRRVLLSRREWSSCRTTRIARGQAVGTSVFERVGLDVWGSFPESLRVLGKL